MRHHICVLTTSHQSLRYPHYSPRSTPISIPGSILLKPGVHDADELQRQEGPSQQRPKDVRQLGVVDVQALLPQHADLESGRLDILQRLPARPDRQEIRWLDGKRTNRHRNCQHLKPSCLLRHP